MLAAACIRAAQCDPVSVPKFREALAAIANAVAEMDPRHHGTAATWLAWVYKTYMACPVLAADADARAAASDLLRTGLRAGLLDAGDPELALGLLQHTDAVQARDAIDIATCVLETEPHPSSTGWWPLFMALAKAFPGSQDLMHRLVLGVHMHGHTLSHAHAHSQPQPLILPADWDTHPACFALAHPLLTEVAVVPHAALERLVRARPLLAQDHGAGTGAETTALAHCPTRTPYLQMVAKWAAGVVSVLPPPPPSSEGLLEVLLEACTEVRTGIKHRTLAFMAAVQMQTTASASASGSTTTSTPSSASASTSAFASASASGSTSASATLRPFVAAGMAIVDEAMTWSLPVLDLGDRIRLVTTLAMCVRASIVAIDAGTDTAPHDEATDLQNKHIIDVGAHVRLASAVHSLNAEAAIRATSTSSFRQHHTLQGLLADMGVAFQDAMQALA